MHNRLSTVIFLLVGSSSAFASNYSACLEEKALYQTNNLQCGQFTQEFLAPIFGNARRLCAGEVTKDLSGGQEIKDLMAMAEQAQESLKVFIEQKVNEKMKVCGETTYFRLKKDGKGGEFLPR